MLECGVPDRTSVHRQQSQFCHSERSEESAFHGAKKADSSTCAPKEVPLGDGLGMTIS
jgi:hypothetical protein